MRGMGCGDAFRAVSALAVGAVLFLTGCGTGNGEAKDYTRLGMTAYTMGDYAGAAAYLRKAFADNPRRSALAHNLACCYALQNERAAALEYVEKALDLGSCLFIEDGDLQALHGEPGYAELAQRAQRLLDELAGREWKPEVVLPPGLDAGADCRWLIALHGYGGNPKDFLDYLGGDIACPDLLICCPYATVPKGTSSFAWGEYPDDERRIISAVDYLRRNFRLRPGPGLILGYSQGGSRALLAGLKNPGLFGGIIVLAGYYDENFGRCLAGAAGKTEVRIIVGSEDQLLDNNRRAKTTLEEAGVPVALAVCPGLGHAAPPAGKVAAAIRELCRTRFDSGSDGPATR